MCSLPHEHESCRTHLEKSTHCVNVIVRVFLVSLEVACHPADASNQRPEGQKKVQCLLKPELLLLDLLPLLTWLWDSFCWSCCLGPDFDIILSFLVLFCPSLSLEMSRNGRGATLSKVQGAEGLSSSLLVGLEIPLNYHQTHSYHPLCLFYLNILPPNTINLKKMCILFFFLNQVQKK